MLFLLVLVYFITGDICITDIAIEVPAKKDFASQQRSLNVFI
jgi:hypothetical protein|tara:strand:+ start:650 stop:775 length:126 start_codon:yes stop_codon:yes gene_type:complete